MPGVYEITILIVSFPKSLANVTVVKERTRIQLVEADASVGFGQLILVVKQPMLRDNYYEECSRRAA